MMMLHCVVPLVAAALLDWRIVLREDGMKDVIGFLGREHTGDRIC